MHRNHVSDPKNKNVENEGVGFGAKCYHCWKTMQGQERWWTMRKGKLNPETLIEKKDPEKVKTGLGTHPEKAVDSER